MRAVNTSATTFEYHGKQYVVVHAVAEYSRTASAAMGSGCSRWMARFPRWLRPVWGGGRVLAPRAARLPRRLCRSRRAQRILKMVARSIARPAYPAMARQAAGVRAVGLPCSRDRVTTLILGTASAGKNNMPAFKSIYSADELNDVTAYIRTTLQAVK